MEWLGPIPQHWAAKAVKRQLTFTTGWTPPTGEEQLYDGDLLWANISDLGPRTIYTTQRTISESAVRAARLAPSPVGSLLFAFKLSVGTVSITGAPMYTNEAIATFIPNSTVDPVFLYWAAPICIPQNSVRNIYGAPLLSRDRIANAIMPFPPLREQRAIGGFLDEETAKLDALIAEKQRLIKVLTEKRCVLIRRTVIRGLRKDVPLKNSGVPWMGEIPEHWEAKRIKWVARMESGHTPDKKVDAYWSEGSIGWISLADTNQLRQADYIVDTSIKTTAEGIANSSAHLLPKGTVVFSRDATIGLCAITGAEMAVSQHFIGWVCRDEVVPEYLLFVLRSMTEELERMTMGATLRTLGMAEVRSLVMPVPPLTEQHAIVEHVREVRSIYDAAIDQVRKGLSKSIEMRNALISAAVTGKIDVREEVS